MKNLSASSCVLNSSGIKISVFFADDDPPINSVITPLGRHFKLSFNCCGCETNVFILSFYEIHDVLPINFSEPLELDQNCDPQKT